MSTLINIFIVVILAALVPHGLLYLGVPHWAAFGIGVPFVMVIAIALFAEETNKNNDSNN